MDSRKKKKHVEAMDHISSIKYAMENPSAEGIKALQAAAQFIQKQHEIKSFKDAKTIPEINGSYLDGFVDTFKFSVAEFSGMMDKIDNPKKYAKQFEIGNPIQIIKSIMASPRVSPNDIDPEDAKKWKILLNQGIDLKPVTRMLVGITGKPGVKAAQVAARALTIVCLVIGTILTNYILFIIAAGLFATDVALDKYLEESSKADSILDQKNYPYILSGSFPLLHVDRTREFKEISFNQNSSFEANNLVELVRKIHSYIDCMDAPYRDKWNRIHRFPMDHFDALLKEMYDAKQPENGENTQFVYNIKQKILSISKMCIDENFTMDQTTQQDFLWRWIGCIEQFCRDCADKWGTASNLTADQMTAEVVPMFEVLCLQIWDAFLQHNHIKKTIPIINDYVKADITDETSSILTYYNSLPTLSYARKEVTANDIIIGMFEAIGAQPPSNLLTEATQETDPTKLIDTAIGTFTKSIQPMKAYLQKINPALKWCSDNARVIKELGAKMTDADSAKMRKYSFNVKNVASSLTLLNSIQQYLTTEYLNKRQDAPANINELISKAFGGGIQITDANRMYPAQNIANVISTGSLGQVQEQDFKGAELQKKYNEASAYLLDKAVVDYFGSGIYDNLEKAVTAFKQNASNANNKPNIQGDQNQNPTPTNAGLEYEEDSILNMFEADGAAPAATMPTPSASPPGQQGQGSAQVNKPDPQKPVVTNATASKDASVLNHATTVAIAVMNIIQLMTADAYGLVSAYYNPLSSRGTQTQEQQVPQTQQPMQSQQ